MPIRRVTLACHALLVVVLVAALLAPALTALRTTAAALLAVPLLAAWPGLARGDGRIEQRLAVLLVPYIGGISVEVVARAGAAILLNAALLVAVLELGLLLALIRRRPHRPSVRE